MVRNPAFIARTTLLSDAEVERKMAVYQKTMTEGQSGEARNRSGVGKPTPGLEPGTPSLRVKCSTN